MYVGWQMRPIELQRCRLEGCSKKDEGAATSSSRDEVVVDTGRVGGYNETRRLDYIDYCLEENAMTRSTLFGICAGGSYTIVG